MSGRAGYYSDYALRLEAAYGTAIAVNRLLPTVTGFTLQPNPEKADDVTLRGTAGREKRIKGLTKVQGGLMANASFGEGELLIAMALGNSGVAGVGPFVHTHDPADLITRSCTLVQRLKATGGNEVREFSGVKVESWKFSGSAGEPFEDEFELVASAFTTASGTNGDAQVDAATAVGVDREVFVPSDVEVLLGDTADALVAGDAVNATEVELLVKDNLALEDFGSEGLAEPERNGLRDVSIKLTLPRLENTTLRIWAENNIVLQCRLRISRAGDVREVRLPALTLSNPGDIIGGPDLIRPTLELVAHRAKGANPTWPTLQDEIQVLLTSALLSGDLLP